MSDSQIRFADDNYRICAAIAEPSLAIEVDSEAWWATLDRFHHGSGIERRANASDPSNGRPN